MSRIHVLTDGGELIALADSPFGSEDELQVLIAEHPEVMTGELLDEPKRWLLITREAGIALAGEGGNRFSMDHLFVDEDGVPTLVEVKRSSDTRSRREVVAQMLDYAANLWAWKPGTTASWLERRCEEQGLDVNVEVSTLLGDEGDAESFWGQVDANITAGRLRLVFVADRISIELRQIIEFLNAQLNQAEVLAVEVRQLRGEGVTTLVSTVIGRTAAAAATKSKGPSGVRLTRQDFVNALRARCTSEEVAGVEATMQWCEANEGFLSFGTGTEYPACYLNWRRPQGPIWPLQIIVPNYVTVPFDGLRARPPFDRRELEDEFRRQLNTVDDISLATTPRPSFPLSVLADADSRAQVLAALDWFRSQLA